MSQNQAMTITEFIRARIDEDERLAREAQVVTGDDLTEHIIGEWWEKPEHGRVYAGHWHRVADGGEAAGQRNFTNTSALPHIARHDPAHVLWDCGVKRRMLGWIERGVGRFDDLLLLELARFWHDHPDFNTEWGNDG